MDKLLAAGFRKPLLVCILFTMILLGFVGYQQKLISESASAINFTNMFHNGFNFYKEDNLIATEVKTTTTTTTILFQKDNNVTEKVQEHKKNENIINIKQPKKNLRRINKNLESDALKEKEPWTKDVVESEVLLTSKYVEIQNQKVKLQNGEVVDWVWVEVQDQVNVVVHRKADNKFLLFNQTKHALTGNSLAVVGGGVESGETYLQAANRELLEEMGLKATKMIPLGNYRVDVNRGMGVISTYLAYDCVQSEESAYSDDLEMQQVLKLSWNDLIKVINQHGILPYGVGEIKWVGALALAILEIIQIKDPQVLLNIL